jgi:hypothetical protein
LRASRGDNDPYAGAIHLGNALDRRRGRDQERGPQADDDRPEVEDGCAILCDSDERHVDLAGAERFDHVRRIVNADEIVRNSDAARELGA